MSCSQQSAEDYLSSAKQHLAQSDLESASIELKNAIKSSPENAEARFLLGKVYLANNKFENAEKELSRAMDNGYPANEVMPLLSVAYQRTGADVALTELSHKHSGLTTEQATQIAFYKLQAYMRLDKKDKAKALIKEIRAFNTESPFKGLTLVYQLLIDKNEEAALIQVDAVLAKAPSHPEALKLKALMLLQQDNKEAAAEVYQTYYSHYPDDHQIAFILARMLTDLNQTAKAEPMVDKLLLINNEHGVLNQLKGLARFNDKDYGQALEYTEKAVNTNTTDLAARIIAGYSAYFLSNFELANQHLSVIAGDLPSEHPALRLLAASQLALGQHLEASETLEQFEQVQQKDASLLSSVGLALVEAGEIEKAKTLVSRSAQVSESAEELTRLGMLQLSLNDIDGIVNLEQAFDIAPQQQSTKKTLATAYLSTGQFDKAVSLANKWKQENEQDPQAFLLAGSAHMKAGRYQKAKSEFQQLLKLDVNNLQAQIALIELDDALGNKEAAVAALEELLGENPSFIPGLIKQYLFAKDNNKVLQGIEQIQQAFNNDKENLGLRLLLAKVQLSEGKNKKVISLLEEYPTEANKTAAYWEILGEAYWRSNDFNKASSHFEKWLEASPNSRPAIFANLVILDGKNEFKQGLKVTSAHMKKNSADMQMRLLHTHFLLMTDDVAGAKSSFDKLSANAKRLPFAKGILGRFQLIEEDFKSALVNIQQAYQASRNSRNVRMIYLCHLRLGNKEQGYNFLANHVKSHAKDLSSLMLLANIQMGQDVDQAIQSYEQALTLQADNFIALNNLAYFYLQKAQLNKAQDYAERALEKQPRNADVLDTLAQILMAKKEYKQALTHLTAATESKDVKEEIYLNYVEALLLNEQLALAKRKLEQRELKLPASKEKVSALKAQYQL